MVPVPLQPTTCTGQADLSAAWQRTVEQTQKVIQQAGTDSFDTLLRHIDAVTKQLATPPPVPVWAEEATQSLVASKWKHLAKARSPQGTLLKRVFHCWSHTRFFQQVHRQLKQHSKEWRPQGVTQRMHAVVVSNVSDRVSNQTSLQGGLSASEARCQWYFPAPMPRGLRRNRASDTGELSCCAASGATEAASGRAGAPEAATEARGRRARTRGSWDVQIYMLNK